MPTANYDDTIIEALRDDPEFLRLYIEDAMQEKDQELFRIALQHIIAAKDFDIDLVSREKEAA